MVVSTWVLGSFSHTEGGVEQKVSTPLKGGGHKKCVTLSRGGRHKKVSDPRFSHFVDAYWHCHIDNFYT